MSGLPRSSPVGHCSVQISQPSLQKRSTRMVVAVLCTRMQLTKLPISSEVSPNCNYQMPAHTGPVACGGWSHIDPTQKAPASARALHRLVVTSEGIEKCNKHMKSAVNLRRIDSRSPGVLPLGDFCPETFFFFFFLPGREVWCLPPRVVTAPTRVCIRGYRAICTSYTKRLGPIARWRKLVRGLRASNNPSLEHRLKVLTMAGTKAIGELNREFFE